MLYFIIKMFSMRGYAIPRITYHGCFFYQFGFLRETLVHPFLVGTIEEDYSQSTCKYNINHVKKLIERQN